jgi:hypothetical protein
MKPLKLTLRQQVNRIEKWLDLADSEEMVAGIQWYNEAYRWAFELSYLHSISTEEVAHITAILSSQCDWETNKANVAKFLSGDTSGIFATKKQLAECYQVLEGWRIPAKRRKTHAFARTIADPSIQELVVIDRHAIKVAFDQQSADPICITDKR